MGKENQFLRAYYHTLGCKLNFAETSAIGRMLRNAGIETARNGEPPDIIIINTCSVTETADHKGRQIIRQLARRWPEATVVVTGCYAQLKPREVADIEGVDIVLGAYEKGKILDFMEKWLEERSRKVAVTPVAEINTFTPVCESGDRTRWFLKVQDGCDYYCTYCTIPYARGRSRSGSITDLVRLAKEAGQEGAREIVITGVNIGEFGRDNGTRLINLIKALDEVEEVDRYRISSIEPNLLTDEIIDFVAISRAFMPHFHIPLQSGSDNVLKMMNRRYTTGLFESRIAHIRNVMPDAFIGVDVIAGARGETEEEWEKSREFILNLPITRLHVFPYSERPGTAALRLPNPVNTRDRHKRVAQLMDISDSKLKDFIQSQEGKSRRVLWEHTIFPDGTIQGFTDNYIRIISPARDALPNNITRLRLSKDNISPTQ